MTSDTRSNGQKLRDTLTINGTGEIPIWGGFSMATWIKYGDELIDLVGKYPELRFWKPEKGTDFISLAGPANREYEEYLDNWGCTWYCVKHGMEGQIIDHPLNDIRHLKHYKSPDPLIYNERGTHDWGAISRACRNANAAGELVTIGGERFFERVHFIRGMENALSDMAEGSPEIDELIDIILQYNLTYLEHALKIGAPVDLVGFGDDWGCQDRCIISADTFRRYFKPGYTKMYKLCKQYGALTTQHSDGHTVDLWEEFLEAGLTAFNMQVNCMGVDVVAELLKGKMCIVASIDRQYILPIGTRSEVREHIAEIATKLGSPKGGLILAVDVYPDVSLDNIDALLSACMEFKDYWVSKQI